MQAARGPRRYEAFGGYIPAPSPNGGLCFFGVVENFYIEQFVPQVALEVWTRQTAFARGGVLDRKRPARWRMLLFYLHFERILGNERL